MPAGPILKCAAKYKKFSDIISDLVPISKCAGKYTKVMCHLNDIEQVGEYSAVVYPD